MRDLRPDELGHVSGGARPTSSPTRTPGSENNHSQGSKHNNSDMTKTTTSK